MRGCGWNENRPFNCFWAWESWASLIFCTVEVSVYTISILDSQLPTASDNAFTQHMPNVINQ